ncbi:MAG TPA: RNA polymerase sigma factor [Terracidiphilus sp.]|jgi:RNA polymerase sigma-70 factor, ECF subfamily
MGSEATYFPNAVAGVPELVEGGADTPVISNPSKNTPSEQPIGAAISNPELSDDLLIQKVCEGSKDALAVLFRKHTRAVRNVAYRILRDESEADDLVQEVFLFLFQKAALFDASKGSASSWIIQIAYHRAINRRQYLTVRQHYDAHELEEQRLSAEEPRLFADAVVAKTLLNRLREQVSIEQRQTLEFHLFDGYSFKEIAEKTGQTLGNVRNHYYRGLERLRACVFPQKGV